MTDRNAIPSRVWDDLSLTWQMRLIFIGVGTAFLVLWIGWLIVGKRMGSYPWWWIVVDIPLNLGWGLFFMLTAFRWHSNG